MKFLLASSFAALIAWTCAQCIRQPVFERWGQLDSSNLVCDGDGGGSSFEVDANRLTHRTFGPLSPERIDGLPAELIPQTLRLVIRRTESGSINKGASFILADGQRYRFGGGSEQRRMFKEKFNVLQALVWGQERGNCPVDSKGQTFPQLASVRISLQTLAATFAVDYCLEAEFRRPLP